MSVPVSRRNLSPHEFVHTYKILCGILNQWMQAVPKRKRKYVCQPMHDNICNTMEYLIRIDEQVFKPKTRDPVQFKMDILSAIDGVRGLPDAMIPYCIICHPAEDKLERIEDLINKEISLLEGVMRKVNESYRADRIKIYSARKVANVKFLSKLRELVLLTHQKIPYVPNKYEYTVKSPATKTIIRAFRYAYAANSIYPVSKDDISRRKILFDMALGSLTDYEDYIVSLFMLSDYDDDLMDQWAHLIVDCRKLISGTIKSDRERLKNLPE